MAAPGFSPAFAAALVAAVVLGLGSVLAFGWSGGAKASSSALQARAAANQFFAALEARQYDRACSLLSSDFYRLNGVPDRLHCVLGLRYGMGFGDLHYRITSVKEANGRATVQAQVNGAPGKLVLVEERGGYKVLALESD